MQKKEITYVRLRNFHLVTYLSLLGHRHIKVTKSEEDNKSYFWFLPSEELEKDRQAFNNDTPTLIKPRTQEKRFYDVKFAGVNAKCENT